MNSKYDQIEELSNSIEPLRDKYVPHMGAAETLGGEIIRALDRITYRYYNDGDKVDEGYGIETVNSSFRFLRSVLPYVVRKIANIELTILDDDEYEERLANLWTVTLDYLNKNLDVFEIPNLDDSRIMSEEEKEAADRWYAQEEEAYIDEYGYEDPDFEDENAD
jgi:hypothetical protein